MNPWIVLIAAGLFEIGWPLGFKLAQTAPAWRMAAIALSVLSMAASGWLLFLAQKHIPIARLTRSGQASALPEPF